jgi:alpha-amylase/alpha-mannosidase (GH57 family)
LEKYICIHGHFYQPPRENPWLEEIEQQDSSYPYHDWNERITAECYAQNTASRILDPEEKIIDIVNNYSKMSFNFGPTLLSWIEKHKPLVYEAILEADRISMEKFSGHGSAIAQAFNHMIMPLANKRDKYTQVIWGIKDFQKRFGRFPEGMWLPETAVDIETIEILSEFGIKFTILAPKQAKRIKKGKKREWIDVSNERVDPTMSYRCILPSGNFINLFFYDGPISQDISFGGLLSSGEAFAKRLIAAFSEKRNWPQLVHIATDGETYGHHHRFGDMALAHCLYLIESNSLAKITNYGEYLEKHPSDHEVEIFENTSWSCAHGIERWRDNCGCNSGTNPGWTQMWRKPLREAMDDLRNRLMPLYEKEASKYLKAPWEARNDYIEIILDRSKENVNKFIEKNSVKVLSKQEKNRVLKLLEMQKNTMLMFTSCGWFFDEISGIETTQIIKYSARVIQLAEELWGLPVEKEYLSILEKASSNVSKLTNGSIIYKMLVKSAILNFIRVGVHYAISSLFEEYPENMKLYCYSARSEAYELMKAGKLRLGIGKVNIRSDITWEDESISFAVLHMGDHNLNGGSRKFMDDEAFSIMKEEITEAFDKGDVPEIIRLMDRHFGNNNLSLRHLFKDEKRKVLNQILGSTLEDVEFSFRQIYENNYTIMNLLYELNMPFPKPFLASAEFILNTDLKGELEEEKLDLDKLEKLINEVNKWRVNIDKPMLGLVASKLIGTLMEKLNLNSNNLKLLENIEYTINLLRSLPLDLDLRNSQNIYFGIAQSFYGKMKDKADKGDEDAKNWLLTFHKVGAQLKVKVS